MDIERLDDMLSSIEADFSQEYAVGVIPRDDAAYVPALVAGIQQLRPEAKVLVVKFPEQPGRTKGIALLRAVYVALGRTAPRRFDSMWEDHLQLLQRGYTHMVVDGAEGMDYACLNMVRRDKGTLPTFLVGRSLKLWRSLEKGGAFLTRRTYALRLGGEISR